jgi:hypothetical protein
VHLPDKLRDSKLTVRNTFSMQFASSYVVQGRNAIRRLFVCGSVMSPPPLIVTLLRFLLKRCVHIWNSILHTCSVHASWHSEGTYECWIPMPSRPPVIEEVCKQILLRLGNIHSWTILRNVIIYDKEKQFWTYYNYYYYLKLFRQLIFKGPFTCNELKPVHY